MHSRAGLLCLALSSRLHFHHLTLELEQAQHSSSDMLCLVEADRAQFAICPRDTRVAHMDGTADSLCHVRQLVLSLPFVYLADC